MKLSTETAREQEGCLSSYFTFVSQLLEHYNTISDNIVAIDGDIWLFLQNTVGATEYAQKMSAKALKYGSVYTEKVVKGLIVESVQR